MRIHLLPAAIAAAIIVLPLRAQAEVTSDGPGPHHTPAYMVVDRLIAQRARLSLDSLQVARLTKLAERLRADRGRLKLVGLDVVPGKSVPRYARVFLTSDEALRCALDLLTSEQRIEAAHLLQASEHPKNPADRPEGDGSRG